MRIRQAAELLGVSDDTVRRWIDNGALSASQDDSGRKVIAGHVLAEFWRNNARPLPPNPLGIGSSARNRFVGLVTNVISDKVMTQVEMQCGPHTVVSLMSTEAARELKLEPGSLAVAVVKATTVIVETPKASEGLAGIERGLPIGVAQKAVSAVIERWKRSQLYEWLRLKGYVAFNLPRTVTMLGAALLTGIAAAHVYVLTSQTALPMYFVVYAATVLGACCLLTVAVCGWVAIPVCRNWVGFSAIWFRSSSWACTWPVERRPCRGWWR